MQTWIERVPLGPRFAGRAGNDLDRIKAMIADGWDLTVLTVKGESYVLVLGCRGGDVGGNVGAMLGAQTGPIRT